MKPQLIGRVLGTGVRVAGRMAGQGLVAADEAVAPRARVAGKAAGLATRQVGGFLRPFGRVGGILWLEVTGAFFLLFALVFGAACWRRHPHALRGPYDRAFVVSALVALLFAYLGASSFVRAGRK